MAQRVITQLVDDIDGTELAEGGETVSFGLDGKAYEIDLSDKNAGKLRDALAKYINAGRRLSGSSGRSGRRASGGGTSDAAQIREWAKGQGLEVPERGRIPASIRDAYEAR